MHLRVWYRATILDLKPLSPNLNQQDQPGTEGTFMLLRSFRAVSVHHIATTLQEDFCHWFERRRSAVGFDQSELGSLLQEIHAAGLTRDAKVYECGTR